MYYSDVYYQNQNMNQDGDRFFPLLWGPLLLGGIGGWAIGAASRPRPYPVPYPTPMPPHTYYSSYTPY